MGVFDGSKRGGERLNFNKMIVRMCKFILIVYPLAFIILSYTMYNLVNVTGYSAEIILNISGHGEQRITHLMDVWMFPLIAIKPWLLAVLFSYGARRGKDE